MEDIIIDIAEILTSYPKGTKLYSPICGECELDCLCYGGDVITVVYGGRDNSNYTPSELYNELDRNHVLCFDRYGRYETTGEVMLFPSKNCRDWNAMKVTQNCKEQNLAEEFRKIIGNMSDEELNQKLKEFELLHNVGPKADGYLEFLEEKQKNEHTTTKCGYCLTVFKYNSSELEEEEDRDMIGYHYYYYAKCPRCGNRILVKALI